MKNKPLRMTADSSDAPQHMKDLPTSGFFGIGRLEGSWTNLVAIIAMISMAVDHLAGFTSMFEPEIAMMLRETVGRIAFPLFAALMAYNIIFRTRSGLMLLFRLLVLAMLSQLPMWLMLGYGPIFYLNAIFTLFGGAVILITIIGFVSRRSTSDMLVIVAVPFFMILGDKVDFGYAGILLVPAFGFLFWVLALPLTPYSHIQREESLFRVVYILMLSLSLSLIAVLGFLSLESQSLWAFPLVGVLLTIYIQFSSSLAGLKKINTACPRVKPWLWRLFYPAHMLLIAFIP